MRVLNLRDAAKQYGKFSMPGFRSGSIIKKVVACMYYFFVLILFVMSIVHTVTYDFADARDVILTVVVEILILLIMLTPVIAIGFSEHYDWHGIKLFVIIMGSICILWTTANFVSSYFSPEYIQSTKPPVSDVQSTSDADKSNSDGTIDGDIIKENIEDKAANDSAASK